MGYTGGTGGIQVLQGIHRGHTGGTGDIQVCYTQVEVRWHQEEDYASTEIPCPSYTRGAFTKKFSELPRVQ